MSQERTDFLSKIGYLYESIMNLRDNDDYIVNQPQMDKFIEILKFFQDVSTGDNGKIEPLDIIPKEESGSITATFLLFNLFGDEVVRFSDIIKHASSIAIEATIDHEVCISVTVPNVFIPKK